MKPLRVGSDLRSTGVELRLPASTSEAAKCFPGGGAGSPSRPGIKERIALQPRPLAEKRPHLRATGIQITGLLALSSILHAATPLTPAFDATRVNAFTEKYCAACHNDVDKEGGFDLTALQFSLANAGNFLTWVKVHDRVVAGEMPPKEKNRPDQKELQAFIEEIAFSLTAQEQAAIAKRGRAVMRRLNRAEYENSLRDIFQAPLLLVQSQLPEDGEAHGFNKVSKALDVSYVHMTRYMSAADYAMREVMADALVRPPTTSKRFYARDQPSMVSFWNTLANQSAPRHTFPVLDKTGQPEILAKTAPITVGPNGDPAIREREAIGLFASEYEGFTYSFDEFRAPATGRYRVKFSGLSVWLGTGGHRTIYEGLDRVGKPDEPYWFFGKGSEVSEGRRSESINVYTKRGPMSRRVGGFDVGPEPSVSDVGEVMLYANETLTPNATRFYRSRPTGHNFPYSHTNPWAQRDGHPGAAFRWMEVEGPIYDESAGAGYRVLFGDLPMQRVDSEAGTVSLMAPVGNPGARGGRGGGRGGSILAKVNVEVVSADPDRDAARLLRAFMQRVYRTPVAESDVALFLDVIQQRRAAGLGFAKAMLVGYAAVLASPQFVYVDEPVGRLDDNAVATRLALYLWNSEPDPALRARAARGELSRPDVLRAETERLLSDPKSGRFVEAFLDYWIDLRKIADTTPSATLYNDYTLDDALTEAAVDETRLYFAEQVRANRPVRTVVDSDFTFLNERLAEHYNIPGVDGVAMRRVKLPGGSVRGGFMTQASVLKVTANGTTTSPVPRGKWIMERIVGHEIPPPPPSVPAVEPDIRGAATIRQQLDQHRADPSCAACHRKIDPPGFALENFDVMGAWRDRYRASAPGGGEVGFGKDGWPFQFRFALPVDAAGEWSDGRTFKDVRDLKRLLLTDEDQLARNFVRQLIVFATGAPVGFSDRAKVEEILRTTKAGGYGMRSLVSEVVQSELFVNK